MATTRRRRIVGIDLARFLAVAGMISAHLLGKDESAAAAVFVNGIPSTLFAVVGGTSIVLAARRFLDAGRGGAAVAAIAARALAVMTIGFALMTFRSGIMIVLVYFGAAMLLAIPWLFVRLRIVLGAAIVLAVATPFANAAVVDAMPTAGRGQLVFGDPVGFVASILFTGGYPASTWLVYLLAGMCIGRGLVRPGDGRSTGDRAPATMRLGSGLAAFGAIGFVATDAATNAAVRHLVAPRIAGAAGTSVEAALEALGSSGYGRASVRGIDLLLTAAPHTGTAGDIVRTASAALVVIGVALLLGELAAGAAGRVVGVLASSGAAPLTVYSTHVIAAGIAVAALADAGTDAPAPWWSGGTAIVAVHLAGAIALGAVLRRLGRRGPLEAVVARFAAAAAGSSPQPMVTGSNAGEDARGR